VDYQNGFIHVTNFFWELFAELGENWYFVGILDFGGQFMGFGIFELKSWANREIPNTNHHTSINTKKARYRKSSPLTIYHNPP
jgi:hypothetical protein